MLIDQAGETRDDVYFPDWGICGCRTALMVAAYYGNTSCVRLLADTEACTQDEDGNTALRFATAQGWKNCAKLLAPMEEGLGENAPVSKRKRGDWRYVSSDSDSDSDDQ